MGSLRTVSWFCAQVEIPFVDLTIPMRRAAAGGKLLYAPEDSHWNPEGHRLVAEPIWEQAHLSGVAAPR